MSIVNLRRVRKRKARLAAAESANTNRIVHGLSASERAAAQSAQDAQTRALDGHKRDGAS